MSFLNHFLVTCSLSSVRGICDKFNLCQAEGDYRGAIRLVINFRESGLKPEAYSYIIAIDAAVKEMIVIVKAVRKLNDFVRAGLVAELDLADVYLMEKYQSDLLADGKRLFNWVMEEGSPSLYGMAHEKLLSMYVCARRGRAAERLLWNMKFVVGKEPDRDLYDAVLAICAFENEAKAMGRLLRQLEFSSSAQTKRSLSWLLRGYIKGGHFYEAAKMVMKMLELGFDPGYLERVAVVQGLRKIIQQFGNVGTYLKLCKSLSNANLVGPCLVYVYIKKHKLWIVRML